MDNVSHEYSEEKLASVVQLAVFCVSHLDCVHILHVNIPTHLKTKFVVATSMHLHLCSRHVGQLRYFKQVWLAE